MAGVAFRGMVSAKSISTVISVTAISGIGEKHVLMLIVTDPIPATLRLDEMSRFAAQATSWLGTCYGIGKYNRFGPRFSLYHFVLPVERTRAKPRCSTNRSGAVGLRALLGGVSLNLARSSAVVGIWPGAPVHAVPSVVWSCTG